LFLLAAEIVRSGKASDPETPAFIRKLLGVPVLVDRQDGIPPALQAPVSPSAGAYLRVTTAPDGSNRYELMVPPKNNPLLLAYGRFCRRLDRIRFRLAAMLFAERPRVALLPVAVPPGLKG
jgi:hypothetical protein